MIMSDTITVRKNWKKKISALCNNVTSYSSYRLDNNFIGETIRTSIDNFENMVLSDIQGHSSLTYNKKTGKCVLHHHSNHWITWINKIDW